MVISRSVTFDESAMLHDKPSIDVSVEKPQKSSVQVEHVTDSGSTPEAEKENIHDVPVVFQPPQRSIAIDRPKRNIQAPKRLIAEADFVVML